VNDRPALLIVNEQSRRASEIDPFVAALEQGGLALRREPYQPGEALGTLIRELQDEVGSVILGGGDGTMNAAADALRETGLPFGILPLGTANDLAQTLHIPLAGAEAARVILAGNIRKLDLGAVNGKAFFNVASVGLSVAVTRQLTGVMKRRLGVLAYPLAAVAALLRTGPFRALLRADGEEITVRTMQIAVGNGRHYGGGMVIDAKAAIDDGQLNVYSLEPRPGLHLLLMARAFRAGEHDRLKGVRTLTCRSLDVTTRRPRDVSADGEIVTRTPAHFTVLPEAVQVFAP